MSFVKKLRTQMGISRSKFAKQLGISYGAVANYELGTRTPQLKICYRLIDVAKKHKILIGLEDIYPRS